MHWHLSKRGSLSDWPWDPRKFLPTLFPIFGLDLQRERYQSLNVMAKATDRHKSAALSMPTRTDVLTSEIVKMLAKQGLEFAR